MRTHGTRAKYVVDKCRCEPCTEANRAYARNRDRHKRRVAYGVELPDDTWVDPTEATEHLAWLRANGIGTRTIQNATGLGRTAIVEISRGIPKRIHRDTAARILAVGLHRRPGVAHVDAGPTWDLINDLLYLGFTRTRIAQELGLKTRALQLQRDRITLANATKVADVYERLIRETAPWHGDYAGSVKRGCKCRRCRATAREYQRARRQQRTTTNERTTP